MKQTVNLNSKFIFSKMPSTKFNRVALIISILWLVLIYPLIHWFCWDMLPERYRLGGGDFGQYYAGAVAAKHGLWNQLYPTPKKTIYDNIPDFQPEFKIPFITLDTQTLKNNWSYFGSLASPLNSDVSQDILNISPRLQSDWHFIYPPPLAVLLYPLGFIDYKTASNVWFMIMTISLFGIGYFATLIYRKLNHENSYAEGCILLSPVIITLLGNNASTTLDLGNSTPILGFLITFVSYAWITNRQAAIAFGMIPLLLLKGVGLSWCPLLLIKPIKWRTIITLTLLTLIINGIAINYGGLSPYKIFFTEIIPKSNIALGNGLQGLLLSFFGVNIKWLFSVFSLFLSAIIYWGLWRQSVTHNSLLPNEMIIASISGTMCIFFLCNPVVWPHYYMIYIFLPFSGWILMERRQALGINKKIIDGVILTSILFWMEAVFLTKISVTVSLLKKWGLYNNVLETMRGAVCFFTYHVAPTIIVVFLLILAIRRLLTNRLSISGEQNAPSSSN